MTSHYGNELFAIAQFITPYHTVKRNVIIELISESENKADYQQVTCF